MYSGFSGMLEDKRLIQIDKQQSEQDKTASECPTVLYSKCLSNLEMKELSEA